MSFGPDTIQPPAHLTFRNPVCAVDDPFGDFTSGEVAAMNRDYRESVVKNRISRHTAIGWIKNDLY